MNTSNIKDYFAKRCTYFKVILLTAIFCMASPMTVYANNTCSAKALEKGKITVCHKTNSVKNPVVTVCINENAFNKHSTNHNDFLPVSYYTDADNDGFGDQNAEAEVTCIAPQGKVDNKLDCNDNNAAINPAANDNCDSLDLVDNNCDGIVDGGADYLYLDADGDGDNANIATYGCEGSTVPGADCDDNDNQVSSLIVEESCTGNGLDGKDNNCDGIIDPQSQLYVDNDGDGFGVGELVDACPGVGFASLAGDCDDSNTNANPGLSEVCDDGIDNNCSLNDGPNSNGIDENCAPPVPCPCESELSSMVNYDTTWTVQECAQFDEGATGDRTLEVTQSGVKMEINGHPAGSFKMILADVKVTREGSVIDEGWTCQIIPRSISFGRTLITEEEAQSCRDLLYSYIDQYNLPQEIKDCGL